MNKKNILEALGARLALLLTTLLAASCNSVNKNATDTTSEQEQPEMTEETLKALAAALPQYSGAGSFHEGLALVRRGDDWGDINARGICTLDLKK